MKQEIALDEARATAFGDRLLETLNLGSLGLMISIGHRTGLFDTLGGAAGTPARAWPDGPGWTSATCASGWARW